MNKMAEAERVVNNSEPCTNNVASKTQEPENQETEQIPEMRGWLMKRTKISHKWKRQHFHLKNTDMFYGDTTEVS